MTSACRVLVLNERGPLHPRAGGAEVHVAEISRRLAPLGFEITQLACGFPGAKPVEALDGMTVRRLGNLAVYYPRAVLTTAWETFRGRFDVVVEHLNKVPFCSRAYSSVPVIAVNHHLFGTSAFLQVAWPVAATVVAIEKLIPLVYRRMPFLAVSESSRQDLVERGIRAEHIDLLLRTVAKLAERWPRLELVLVGRRSERDALERLAAELGIAERTRFAGFVSDEERDALLAEARVCVSPSVKEGWGITVIEANALGVPVVATDAPGLRDAVRHDETGLLVADAAPEVFSERLTAAVERLLTDETLLARLSSQALVWSRRFDWDSSAQRMAEVIEETRRRLR